MAAIYSRSDTQGVGASLFHSRPQNLDLKTARHIGTQFEAILLRQYLHMVRESSNSDSATATSRGYLQMADDQMAEHLAKSGGLGIADVYVRQVKQQQSFAELIKTGR